MILSNSFSILSELKLMSDYIYENQTSNINTNTIRNNIKDIENIIEIKNIIQNNLEKDVLLILSENNPNLFVKIRALSGIIYRLEEVKKPLIGSAKYYEKIEGYTQYLLDDVIRVRGPIVSLNQLYFLIMETGEIFFLELSPS